MKRRTLKTGFAAALLTWAAAAHAQKMTDDQIAEKFVPSAFTAYAASHTYFSDSRSWTVLPVDLDHSGREDYLAVAYGNAHIAYLSVIRKGPIPKLVAESSPSTGCDGSPGVSAIDLDGDGKPELNLSCHVGNHGATFNSLFKWSAGGLVVLNAPHPRRRNAWSPIREANFIDLDGDGVMEVLEAPGDTRIDEHGVVTERYDIYRLLNGALVKSPSGSSLVFFDSFTRGKGKPKKEAKTFAATAGPYKLTIIKDKPQANDDNNNGDDGDNGAAVITLNGVVLTDPSNHDEQGEHQGNHDDGRRPAVLDVTLAEKNTITVEMHGSRGSSISIVIGQKP